MKKNTLLLLLPFLFWLQPLEAQITHMVMFKLRPGITKTDERYRLAVSKLQDLPSRIKSISDFSAGENFSTRPIAWDYGLIVVLESEKDLQEYLVHPAHLEASNRWKEIAEWHIVDFREEGE